MYTQVASLMNDEAMTWMPSSKVPQFLIKEFESENKETESTLQPHATNSSPTKEPPNKVQKHDG